MPHFSTPVILVPIFESNQKSCFTKATNRKAQNFLEIFSRPTTGTSCSFDKRKLLCEFTLALHLSLSPHSTVSSKVRSKKLSPSSSAWSLKMPRPKRDHSSSLQALCVCCGRKPPRDGNLRSIKEEWGLAVGMF